ncbi:MAG: Asp-tRNA(Asn)/Glu-tRNA(Gln) amidotransferase subunit GatB [Clostridia bacterium]|nr:Asp-tRNA(Asn)/Glu-tRNA(Gln) amidotransferase subunit GatB [Clostridia bacterium]
MEYEVVIGLEIHVELATETKIFCDCTTAFGGEVNTHCCPICTGMPGTLPVMNEKVVEYAIRAGIALNCEIAHFSKMDRKNYFYPDLPKAYQVSQFDLPLCKNGYVDIEVDGKIKRIGITRIHMEEDAGKLIHDQWGTGSLIDYNRCGVPLIEIVSEPDIRSAEEAKAYVEKVRSIIQYIGASDCKMQEGSLRADVNLSVRPIGQEKFGTRTEMKNLNSFKSILRAAEHEQRRQISEIEHGNIIVQETRRWDDTKGKSYSMRSKEEAHDYRYFPEPDLVPIELTDEQISKIRKELPELPEDRVNKYINDYQLPEYDAKLLTVSKNISDFFEQAVTSGANPKKASNYIMGDLMKLMNQYDDEAIPFDGDKLAKLISLVEAGTISQNIASKVLSMMYETRKDPAAIVKEENLAVVNDESALSEMIENIIAQHTKSVNDYLGGNTKAIGFLIGQVMQKSKGKGNPQMISRLLEEKLNKLK